MVKKARKTGQNDDNLKDYYQLKKENKEFERLVEANKKHQKECDLLFEKLDLMFKNGLDYSLERRFDGAICMVPGFVMSGEYRALLKEYNEKSLSGRWISDRIDVMLGYNDAKYKEELRLSENNIEKINLNLLNIGEISV